ncbi:MAG: hypothetical protein ACE5FI_13510 [Anaerolineales bacterium]
MKKPLIVCTIFVLAFTACSRVFGPSPTVADREATIAVAQSGAPMIGALSTSGAVPDNPQPGTTYELVVPLDSGREVLWGFGWCTRTQLQLRDNWDNMELAFKLNGRTVALDQFLVTEQIDVGLGCRNYFVALTEWPVGEHLLTTEVTFNKPLDDGFFEYPRGKFVVEHHVTVSE